MSASLPKATPRNGQLPRMALLAWCAAALIAAGVSVLAGIAPRHAAIGAGLCLLPAALGFALTPLLRHEWAQVALVCAWVALALAAALALGAGSAAACWFLLPPIVAFTLGRRSLILETGVSSLLAFGLASALEIGGLAPPFYPAASYPVLAVLAVMMAVALATGAAIGARRFATMEQLRARRRFSTFDHVAEQMPAVALRLAGNGDVVGVAGAVETVLRMERVALMGQPLTVLAADAETGSAVQAALDEARRFGRETVLDISMPDGASLELRIAPEGALVLAVDVTERAGRERAAFETRDAALAASEAKTRYLAGMSHEIRTPLNAIIGFSDVMKQRLFGPLPARYAEYADLIHESGLHLLDLVGDVLDMSKIEADRYELKLESMDARDIAGAAARLMRLRAEDSGVRLELDCGLAPLPVRADRKALRQILLNLLSNALKFTPKGGEARVALRSEGGELVLEVADTGVGMSAEDAARLGQPYQQADSAGATTERGSGLGLSLVSALAQMHGGGLEIESEPGKGTTARVRLPVLEAQAAPVTRLDARAQIQRAAAASEEILKVQVEAGA